MKNWQLLTLLSDRSKSPLPKRGFLTKVERPFGGVMTTGNTNVDNSFSVMCLYDGDPLTSATAGSYRSRVWEGGDDPVKDLPRRTFTEHVYYVPSGQVTRKGFPRKPVKRKYRTYTRIKHDRGLHAYDSLFVTNYMPATSFTSVQTRTSTGAVLSSNLFTNTPITLFIGGADATPTPVLSSDDQWRAISRLRQQIVGTPFNLAVSLGEARETLGMIGETARKLAMSAVLLKRGHFKAALRELNDPRAERYGVRHGSNQYLMVTYGMAPLLNDIRNGAESLSHHLNVPIKRRYSTTIYSSQNQSNGNVKTDVGGRVWTSGGYTLMTRRIIAYISETPGLWETLGFSDPLSVVWELTPLSFVADWVLPIGDYLEARASASVLRGTFVQTDLLRKKLVGDFEGVFIDPSLDITSTIRGGSPGSSLEYSRVTRTILTSLPVPMPDLKSLNTDFSWRHAASGLALMVQAFSGSNTGKSWIRG